jgi:glycosyltransferase involved in cell wall biosynthesis
MKILFITTYAPSLIKFRGFIIRELLQRGNQVYAISPRTTDQVRRDTANFGINLIEIPFSREGINPFTDLWSLVLMFYYILSIKPKCVFSYFAKSVVYGSMAAWVALIPKRISLVEGLGSFYVPSSQGELSIFKSLIKYLITFLYELSFLLSTDVIFLNSDDPGEFTIPRLFPEKIKIINGIGVDLQYWKFHHPHTDPIKFIMCTRLLKEKGVCYFVEAAKSLKRTNSDIEFLLLGEFEDTSRKAFTFSELQSFSESGLINYVGFQDPIDWYHKASVFVLPTFYREGLPASLQEAMACGLPVITTNVPGCRDAVLDGINGFLIPPHDIDAIVKAMRRFIDNPDLVFNMSLASRNICELNFDVRRQSMLFVDVCLSGAEKS